MKPPLHKAKARPALTQASLITLTQFQRALLSAIARRNITMQGNEPDQASMGVHVLRTDKDSILEQFHARWNRVERQRKLFARRKENSNRTEGE
jgi:hypothetical protein